MAQTSYLDIVFYFIKKGDFLTLLQPFFLTFHETKAGTCIQNNETMSLTTDIKNGV